MRLRALAKINLGLDVLGKREDGYHELRMIMQTINMYDQLEIEVSQEPGIHISTNLPFIPTNENNLVYKAAKLLMDEFQITQGVRWNSRNLFLLRREWQRKFRCCRGDDRSEPAIRTGTLCKRADGKRSEDRSRTFHTVC